MNEQKRYAPQEKNVFWDDGRERELLLYVQNKSKVDGIRGSPARVLEAIDEFATQRYLMNIGKEKGKIITDLIAMHKPGIMVELGGYVGYSAILFGDALRRAGGCRYWSLEANAEFAAIIKSLVAIAGLSDIVTVVVGMSHDSLRQMHANNQLKRIDMLFLDHYKPAYLDDFKLCEQLQLVQPGSLTVADNVIKPGNPPYLRYVRSTPKEKREQQNKSDSDRAVMGDSSLVYESRLVESFQPTGVPVSPTAPFRSSLFTISQTTNHRTLARLWNNQYFTSARAMEHLAKNIGLLICCSLFLPINTAIVVTTYIWTKVIIGSRNMKALDDEPSKTILVTGMSMAKALSIARLFHGRGHRVIGADWHWLALGRFSQAVDDFYQLPHPIDSGGSRVNPQYLRAILDIIERERVDLVIPVSDVIAPLEDAVVKEVIEARFGTKCIQANVKHTALLHGKASFMEHTRTIGLQIPTKEIITFLREHGGLALSPRGKQFLIKPLEVDDLVRSQRFVVPLGSPSETLARLNQIRFPSSESSYLIQEFIQGDEFCTHSLVIRDRVCAFVACPSTDVLTHYTALPCDLPLTRAMVGFTVKQAQTLAHDFTGHLSFDFIVLGDQSMDKLSKNRTFKLYPIECNPRVHTATVLFDHTPELVDEYLSVLSASPRENPSSKPILTPKNANHVYWIAQDWVEFVLNPICRAFTGQGTLTDVLKSLGVFIEYLVFWKDGVFSVKDPWPFWWMCHVVWPLRFAKYLVRGRWNKINISTGKVFEI
ncbi:putative O-methyltransferase [Mariannaea sp. PMI_226]|nr:putative O-methyltransferase [Mariannaea sp. PMI_226]